MLTEILDRLFSRNAPPSSRDTARRRLQIVLAHDRADLTPAIIEQMREEIMQVVSRYVEIDPMESEFALENDRRTTALIANLPIKRVKTEAERLEAEAMPAPPREPEKPLGLPPEPDSEAPIDLAIDPDLDPAIDPSLDLTQFSKAVEAEEEAS